MNKKLVIGIIVGVVVIGTVTGIVIYNKNKNKSGGGNDGGSSDGKGGSSSGSDTPTSEEQSTIDKLPSDTVIKIGSKGRKVAMYQAWLNWKYGAGLTVDGRFGDSLMKAARKHLDSTCGLSVKSIGDTECRLDNNYKVNKLLTVDLRNPAFSKYMKYGNGIQKVFSQYK